jgi:hypothetical protein
VFVSTYRDGPSLELMIIVQCMSHSLDVSHRPVSSPLGSHRPISCVVLCCVCMCACVALHQLTSPSWGFSSFSRFSQADGPNQPQYTTTSAGAGYAPSSLWPSQAHTYHDPARSRSSFGDAFHTSNTLARPTDLFTPSAFVSPQ